MKLEARIDQQELIARCIKGDPRAQEMLYRKHSAMMYGACLRYARDAHEAEDILQEAFVKVFNKLHTYRNEGALEGWLRRVAVTTAIEQYRRNTRMVATRELEDHIPVPAEDHTLSQIQAQDLLDMVQELAPGYRMVFNLFVIEGLNHEEIAAQLGISEGTSKSQLARAKAILRDKVIKGGYTYAQVR